MMASEAAPIRKDKVAKLKNGWMRICLDMGRALTLAYGGPRALFFWVVMERTWGVAWLTRYVPGGPAPDCEPTNVNVTDLARLTGIGRTILNRAKWDLIRDGSLIEHEDGRLEPSKDYTSWAFYRDPARADSLDFVMQGADFRNDVRSDMQALTIFRSTSMIPCPAGGLDTSEPGSGGFREAPALMTIVCAGARQRLRGWKPGRDHRHLSGKRRSAPL